MRGAQNCINSDNLLKIHRYIAERYHRSVLSEGRRERKRGRDGGDESDNDVSIGPACARNVIATGCAWLSNTPDIPAKRSTVPVINIYVYKRETAREDSPLRETRITPIPRADKCDRATYVREDEDGRDVFVELKRMYMYMYTRM